MSCVDSLGAHAYNIVMDHIKNEKQEEVVETPSSAYRIKRFNDIRNEILDMLDVIDNMVDKLDVTNVYDDKAYIRGKITVLAQYLSDIVI